MKVGKLGRVGSSNGQSKREIRKRKENIKDGTNSEKRNNSWNEG